MIKLFTPLISLLLIIMLCGCDPATKATHNEKSKHIEYSPIEITHSLGTTVIQSTPTKVVALDMNEVDTLAQLHIPIAGMPKDFVPHFLTDYKENQHIRDVGAIVQPNIEQVYKLKPDLILISSLQANHYKALSELAPTLHFDVNYLESSNDQIETITDHMLILGDIFNKQTLAKQAVAKLEAKLQHAKKYIEDRPEKAMILLHNNGALRFFGTKSRYGFIYSALGIKPASSLAEAGSHGQPISHEFIYKYNPDIIYVIDRTAVMEGKKAIKNNELDNPLLRKTNAWKNNHIHIVDSEAWYITGSSYTSLMIMINDILKGYSV